MPCLLTCHTAYSVLFFSFFKLENLFAYYNYNYMFIKGMSPCIHYG